MTLYHKIIGCADRSSGRYACGLHLKLRGFIGTEHHPFYYKIIGRVHRSVSVAVAQKHHAGGNKRFAGVGVGKGYGRAGSDKASRVIEYQCIPVVKELGFEIRTRSVFGQAEYPP